MHLKVRRAHPFRYLEHGTHQFIAYFCIDRIAKGFNIKFYCARKTDRQTEREREREREREIALLHKFLF